MNTKELDKWFRGEGSNRLKRLAKEMPHLNAFEAANIVMDQLLKEQEKQMGLCNIEFDRENMVIKFNREH